MARILATYSDGASVLYDDATGDVVTGDEPLLKALAAQGGVAPPIPEAEPLLLAAYDASPEHFIAATRSLRDPGPTYEMDGVEVLEAPVTDFTQIDSA